MQRLALFAALTSVIVLFQVAPAHAAPVITSACSLTATARLPWSCDEDGLPSADGQGPFEWSLTDGPEDMFIDNISGEIFWAPQDIGLFHVGLHVVDASGLADEQSFDVDVIDAVPPKFIIEDGTNFDFLVGTLSWFTQQDADDYLAEVAPGLRATGTPPLHFWADDSPCLTVLADGVYIMASAVVGECNVTMHVANWAGIDTISLPVRFDERLPSEALLQAVLVADRTEGTAPDTITFSARESIFPDPVSLLGSDWGTQVFFTSGDPRDHMRPLNEVETTWLYEEPGTYEARLVLWLKISLARAPFLRYGSSYAILPWQYEMTIMREAVVPIVISHEGRLPPQASLMAQAFDDEGAPYEALVGNAPLRVDFSSSTILGDGVPKTIGGYVLDFGDGNERHPVLTGTFEDPPPVSHYYAQPGYYTGHLTVTTVDSEGGGTELASTASIDILVLDEGHAPPIARVTASPSLGEVPFYAQLFGQTGDTDGYVVGRHWVLPDGSTSTDEVPTIQITEPGEYRARLVVTDNDGLITESAVTVQGTRDGVLPARIVSLPERKAEVGYAYRYDEDGSAEASGGGPYRWTLGKMVNGERVHVTPNMSIDERTGEIRWTPSPEEQGEIAITVAVENVAGVDVQSFVVIVAAQPAVPESAVGVGVSRGWGCSAGTQHPSAGSLPLVFGSLFIARMRRRRSAS